jgi:hypothetical protein
MSDFKMPKAPQPVTRVPAKSKPATPEKPNGWVGPAPRKSGAFQQVNAFHVVYAVMALAFIIAFATWIANRPPSEEDKARRARADAIVDRCFAEAKGAGEFNSVAWNRAYDRCRERFH